MKNIKINNFNSDTGCVYFNHLGVEPMEYKIIISWNGLTLYSVVMELTNDTNVDYFVGFNREYFKYLDYIDISFIRNNEEEKYNLIFSGKEVDFTVIPNLETNRYDSSYYSYNEVFIRKVYEDEVVRIREKDVVVDIGANYGFFSLYAEMFSPSKIICFEPSASVFEMLSKNVKNADLHNIAISDNSTQAKFIENFNSSASSRLSNNSDGYNVEVIGVNDLFDYLNLNFIDYLKIDCEGSEKEIFESIKIENLKKIKKIVVEYHSLEIKEVIEKKLAEGNFIIKKDENGILFSYNPSFFKGKKKIALISTYCDTDEKKQILLDNVKKIKKLGVDVIAISPIPLPENIIKECDYIFFTKENPILTWPTRLFEFWHQFQLPDGRISTMRRNVGDYGWAALFHVKKLTQIAMTYDYEIFYHMIYDLDIDFNVEEALENFQGNIIYTRRDPHHPETLWDTTLHFMSFDRDLMGKIEKDITYEGYLSTDGVAEGEVLKWKIKYNIPASEFPVRDKIFYWKDYDFFDYSPVDDFKMFISKNTDMQIWVGENPPKQEHLTSNFRIVFYNIKVSKPVYLIINQEIYMATPKNYEYEEFPISSQDIEKIVLNYDGIEYDLTEKFNEITLNRIFYNHN